MGIMPAPPHRPCPDALPFGPREGLHTSVSMHPVHSEHAGFHEETWLTTPTLMHKLCDMYALSTSLFAWALCSHLPQTQRMFLLPLP